MIPVIDFVRAVSIILVMLLHLNVLFPGAYIGQGSGGYGVTMFFVVSGFVIMRRHLQRLDSPRTFYARRLARLAPLMAVAIASICVCLVLPHGPGWSGIIWNNEARFPWAVPLALATFTMNWTLILLDVYFHGYGMAFTVFWSLAVEEQFYLAFPWIMRLKGSIKHFLALLILLGHISRVIQSQTFEHGTNFPLLMGSFTGFEGIAAGMWLAIWHNTRVTTRWPWVQMLVGFASMVCTYRFLYLLLPITVWGTTFMTASLVLFLRGALMLSIRWPLQAIGRLSYSAYLFHAVVLYAAYDMLVAIGPIWSSIVFPALVFVVSAVLHRYIELPGKRWILKWSESH